MVVACGRRNANEGKRGGEMVNKKFWLWMMDFNSMEGKRGSVEEWETERKCKKIWGNFSGTFCIVQCVYWKL